MDKYTPYTDRSPRFEKSDVIGDVRERDHGCDWHDILIVSNCVGVFCAIVLLITILVFVIIWHS